MPDTAAPSHSPAERPPQVPTRVPWLGHGLAFGQAVQDLFDGAAHADHQIVFGGQVLGGRDHTFLFIEKDRIRIGAAGIDTQKFAQKSPRRVGRFGKPQMLIRASRACRFENGVPARKTDLRMSLFCDSRTGDDR